MDNLFCYGTEERLSECRFDGWGTHDCELDESAGVVCETHFSTTTVAPTLPPRDEPVITNKTKLSVIFGKWEGRQGGRIEGANAEGREGRCERGGMENDEREGKEEGKMWKRESEHCSLLCEYYFAWQIQG